MKKIEVEKNIKSKTVMTILWLIFTLLLIAIVHWPIYSNQIDYQFYFNNILFLIVFIVFFRYIFLIKHTFIENTIFIKLIIMPLGIFMSIYSYMALNDFIEFYQGNGIYFLLDHFSLEKQTSLGNYIQRQYMFLGVAALVTSVIIHMRMLISVFRVYNRGHE